MAIIEVRIDLFGENFSPLKISSIDGIVLQSSKEPCHIGRFGKYRGKPTPYGSCSVCPPENISQPESILWLARFAKPHLPIFSEAGATDIVFWILWSGIQGNMEFTPFQMQAIAELGVPFCIDYIHLDEDEDFPCREPS